MLGKNETERGNTEGNTEREKMLKLADEPTPRQALWATVVMILITVGLAVVLYYLVVSLPR